MVAGLVSEAQGGGRTEEPWTWGTRAAPPESQHKQSIRSDRLHLNPIRFNPVAPFHYTTDPQTLNFRLHDLPQFITTDKNKLRGTHRASLLV